MKLRKEVFIVVYVVSLLLNDPQLLRAHAMAYTNITGDLALDSDVSINPFLEVADSDAVHLAYALNGGEYNENPLVIPEEDLPYQLAVPEREGYNFAGWYTDSSYRYKITEINCLNARDMVLFAKWTPAIDNFYNVEMYSYRSSKSVGSNNKELKECSYDFLENIEIPGMPSTREQDYLENLIASDAQCMQGLCFTEDYILMSAYSEKNDAKGALMVFDRTDCEYKVTLGMREDSHLGGIAYDGENIWICHSSSKTLERIPYEYIQMIAEDEPKCLVDASALTDEYHLKNIPSSITCYGDRIWVATHTKILDSEMLSYSYDKENDTLTAISTYRIPSKVQGVAFDENGAVYLSTSYGRNNSSYLKVYTSLLTLTKSPNQPSAKVEMPPCAEQIAVADGNVYVIFESASKKYFEGTDGNGKSSSPIDKVLEVNVASIW